MRRKKTVALIWLSAAIILGAACASASELNVQVDAPRIEASGSIGDSAAPVSIIVLNSKVDYTTISRAELIAESKYITQLTTEADGSFTLAVYLDPSMPADQYTMYVQSDSERVSEPFYYINKEGAGLILEKFNAAGVDELEALLRYYSADVPILKITLDAEYEQVKAKVHMEMAAYRDRVGSFSTLETVETIFKQSMAYQELCNADAANLDAVFVKYKDVLQLATDEFYSENKDELIRLFILHRDQASDGGFADFEAMVTALQECQLIVHVNQIEKVSEMDRYIAKNAKIIGISAEKYNAYKNPTVGSALIGKGFTTVKAIKEAIEARMVYLDGAKKPESGSSSPSGGSGSGSGGGGISIVTNGAGQNVLEKNLTETPFTDLNESEWAREAILSLWKKGVVHGMSEKEFQPNTNVTREAFITMIVNAFDLQADGASCDFTDVAPDAWYYHSVATANTLGIAAGIGDGAFGVGDAITRQDMAVIIDKTVQHLKKTLPPVREYTEFADALQISEYAAASVKRLYMAGVINGMGDGLYIPLNPCTRAQAAVLINGVTALGD